jgi:glycosyltransferase involved in cell wall biosynthesis
MRLLILSNVIHYRHGGRLHAYGAYAREIDVWADLFSEVVIAAPCRETTPAGFAVPFSHANISILPQLEVGGETWRAKLIVMLALPVLVLSLCRAMLRADAVHIRCPGSFGLLGALLAPLFCRRRVAKYAGQWDGFPGEPWTVRLQRRMLASNWWKAPVTVYGRHPGQPDHVIPFFTSVMTDAQVARARVVAASRTFRGPLRLLFIGRLSAAKNVDVMLRAAARLPVECTVVGEGPERARLEALTRELGCEHRVHFTGGLAFERVLEHYENSDVLVLASETEGWPKAIAEAMSFGMVCVGSDRGLVPQMLGEGRGFVVPPRDVEALRALLACLASDPKALAPVGARAALWAQQYSIDGLREALRNLLVDRWKVELAKLPQYSS